MTDTALIGSRSLPGQHWAAQRYVDYLVNSEDLHLLQGHSYGSLVIIDPAFETGPLAARQAPDKDAEAVATLLRALGDIKADRAILITTADLLPDDGDENSPLADPQGDAYLTSRRDLYNLVNLRFGRVLTVFIPELGVPNCAFSMLGTLKNPPETGALPLSLLEYHQLYPLDRLVGDVEKLLPLGVSRFVAAMPPLTSSELVETLTPALTDRQPNAHRSDPQGSRRKSLLSFHWLDPRDGYLATKEALLSELAQLIARPA